MRDVPVIFWRLFSLSLPLSSVAFHSVAKIGHGERVRPLVIREDPQVENQFREASSVLADRLQRREKCGREGEGAIVLMISKKLISWLGYIRNRGNRLQTSLSTHFKPKQIMNKRLHFFFSSHHLCCIWLEYPYTYSLSASVDTEQISS